MPVFNNALAGAAGSSGADAGYKIERSLRFNGDDSAHLRRNMHRSARRCFTLSCWVKNDFRNTNHDRIFSAGTDANNIFDITLSADSEYTHLRIYGKYGGSVNINWQTKNKFRDPSAWWHLVVAVDTRHSSSAADRIKVYINGRHITENGSTNTLPGHNGETAVGSNQHHYFGRSGAYTGYLYGYLAEVHYVDGRQLPASDFGETDSTTGVWIPKEYEHPGGSSEAVSYAVDNSDNSFDGNPGNYDTTGLTYGSWGGSVENTSVGGQGANSVQVLKTNSGNAVTWNITTGTTNRWIHTSSDGINWSTQLMTISGGTVQVTSAWLGWAGGANSDFTAVSTGVGKSFYLDFSDNSTTAKLGEDKVGDNDWDVIGIKNKSINYTKDLTTSSSSTFRDRGKIFDGTTFADATIATGQAWIEFNPSTPISYTNSVRVMGGGSPSSPYNTRWQLNNNALVNAINNSTAWVTLASGSSGTINKIRLQCDTAGLNFRAIEVDGVVLADVTSDSLLDTPTNSTPDTGNPTGNYPTWNPLDKHNNMILSDGNLRANVTDNAYRNVRATMAFPTTGKWYYEGIIERRTGYGSLGLTDKNDYADSIYVAADNTYYVSISNSSVILRAGATSTNYSTAIFSPGQGAVLQVAYDADNNKIWFGVNNTWMGDGINAWYGNPSAGTDPTLTNVITNPADCFPACSNDNTQLAVNFGQQPWVYTPPTGFKALCAQNLPDPAVVNPKEHFLAKVYGGNNSTQTITTGFEPDLLWIKHKDHNINHKLQDAVGGFGAVLEPDENRAAVNITDGVTGTTSTGFNLGNSTDFNVTGRNYITWAWATGANSDRDYTVKVVNSGGQNYFRLNDYASTPTLDLAEGGTYTFDQSDSSNSGHPLRFSTTQDGTHGGGSEYTTGVTTTGTPGQAGAKTTITVASGAPLLWFYCSAHPGMGTAAYTNTTKGASNFDGARRSTTVTDTTSGISIIKWTGNGQATSIGHGLGVKPGLILVKNTADARSWVYWHKTFLNGNTGQYMYLDTTDGKGTGSKDFWNTTSPTSSVFHISSDSHVNPNTNRMAGYVFSEVEGFSKFGSYEGNADRDNGRFIYCGFQPAMILFRNTSGGQYWAMYDNARDEENPVVHYIRAEEAQGEQDGVLDHVDFLSNGFKVRMAFGFGNGNGQTITYAAFASAPFKYSRAY